MNPGGIADKLGNRYEAKWLVRCFFDVIADKAQWLKFESIDPQYAGFEFAVARGDITTWHQTKENAPKGNWTVNALKKEGVLKAFASRLLADNNAHCHFISQDGADDFRRLTEKSRLANDYDQYKANLSKKQSLALQTIEAEWDQSDGGIIFDWLNRSWLEVIPGPELDAFIESYGDLYFNNGGKSAFPILRDLLERHFNKTLTTDAARNAIKSQGVLTFKAWAFDPTISQRLNRFMQNLAADARWMKIKPVFNSHQLIDIRDLYVELSLVANDREGLSAYNKQSLYHNDDSYSLSNSNAIITAESLLSRVCERNILIGPPGSGKSTFLRWICAYLIDDFATLKLCPIPISLRSFAHQLGENADLSLWTFAWRQFSDADAIPYPDNPQAFADGTTDIIFLLDGWDEIPVSMRPLIRDRINTETNNIRTLITSRQTGMPDLLQDGKTSFYELKPLTEHAIVQLCTRHGKARHADFFVPEILDLLEKTPSLWPVAKNPYLLTLFIEVIFGHRELPHNQSCSAFWIISEAIAIMQADHNHKYPNSLTTEDLLCMESLAHHMSFGESEKQVCFDPNLLLPHTTPYIPNTPLMISRFFNVTDQRTATLSVKPQAEFSHLRLQEFFAAKSSVSNSVKTGIHHQIDWVIQKFLSSYWREEVKFIGAMLIDDKANTFWLALKYLAAHTDMAGEIIRRIAAILSTAGIQDGGMSLLGIDIRWQLLHSLALTNPLLKEDLSALIELDVLFLTEQVGFLLDEQSSALPMMEPLLLEMIYRQLPYQLRKEQLDQTLCMKPMHSWLLGLPTQAFQSIETLRPLINVAIDKTQSEEVRLAAIRDLGAARAISGTEALLTLINDPSDEIAIGTIETLSKISGREVAMAMARLLITESNPNRLCTLLNGITIRGYGIIEPHSCNYLIAAIDRLPQDHLALPLVLEALEGCPIPRPPEGLLDILSGKGEPSEALKGAAAGVFYGIITPSFISKALALLASEKSSKIRNQLMHACQFIPVNYPDVSSLWQHFICDEISQHEKEYLLLLFIRTARRFPNHPANRRVFQFMKATLEHIADGHDVAFEKTVVKHAVILTPRKSIHPLLLAICNNSQITEAIRALAVKALADDPHDQATLNILYNNFKHIIEQGTDAPALLDSLAEALCLSNPRQIPALLQLADTADDKTWTMLNCGILKLAHKRGFIVFTDSVTGPDGITMAG